MSRICFSVSLIIATLMALGGCSSNKSTSTDGSAVPIALPAFDQLIDSVAPPVFTAPSSVSGAMVAGQDTGLAFWNRGNDPLLARTFGESKPMALHRNVRRIMETVRWLNLSRQLGDSTFSGFTTDDGVRSGTIRVQTVAEPVFVPQASRSAIGDLPFGFQHQVEIRLNEQTEFRFQAACAQNDSCDHLLAYQAGPSPDSAHPSAFEYSLTYAYRNRIRDSFQVRAVHFRTYNDPQEQCAMWAYQITSQQAAGFFYRATWFADDFDSTNGLGCLVGSGQNQTRFALRYHQMIPADRPTPDSLDPNGQICRMFGAGYSDQGTSLSTAWNEAVDSSHMFTLEQLPVLVRNRVMSAEEALSPWFQK